MDSYEQVLSAINKVPKTDMKSLLGELNKKEGIDNTNSDHIMGIHYTGGLLLL